MHAHVSSLRALVEAVRVLARVGRAAARGARARAARRDRGDAADDEIGVAAAVRAAEQRDARVGEVAVRAVHVEGEVDLESARSSS